MSDLFKNMGNIYASTVYPKWSVVPSVCPHCGHVLPDEKTVGIQILGFEEVGRTGETLIKGAKHIKKSGQPLALLLTGYRKPGKKSGYHLVTVNVAKPTKQELTNSANRQYRNGRRSTRRTNDRPVRA